MSQMPPSFRGDAKHRARNPFHRRARGLMDSGLALRARNDGESYEITPVSPPPCPPPQRPQAPASAAAATAAIASAATSAGLAEGRASDEWAAALSVTVVLRSTIHAQTGNSVLSRRRLSVEARHNHIRAG